ncbi:MAG: NAD(P)H:quinone oxidoreductase [Pseudomonadota bacterium]|nr:NAD(P)H:quinone oxidoreductase [Pseudomonadota bacterium]|tara:strand:+ start:360 stop:941 length:582 start_codon:yes stop_codon:yes gene_type:complete
MKNILILYYSRKGSTHSLANHAARGVEAAGLEASIRTLPSIPLDNNKEVETQAKEGAPFASLNDLKECNGLLLGSPTRFGNMAAPVKLFLDTTSSIWLEGSLIDKPFGVFTSSNSMHAGQETTLLTMAIPLIHHGMVWVGLPYTEKSLRNTKTGGSPYGASHVALDWNKSLSDDEKKLAFCLGKRVATLASKL